MRLIIVILSLLAATSCFAEVYIALDKDSGEPQGTVEVKPDNLADWSKTYTMKQADESYRGKARYEIKIDDGKIRHATEQEIKSYKDAQEVIQKDEATKAALATLGITAKDIAKIKKLPEAVA